MNFQHYLFSILFMRLLKQLSNVKRNIFRGVGATRKISTEWEVGLPLKGEAHEKN